MPDYTIILFHGFVTLSFFIMSDGSFNEDRIKKKGHLSMSFFFWSE